MWNLIGKVKKETGRWENRRRLCVAYQFAYNAKGDYDQTCKVYLHSRIAKRAVAMLHQGDLVEFCGDIRSSRNGGRTFLIADNFSILEANPKGRLMASPPKKIPQTLEGIFALAARSRP